MKEEGKKAKYGRAAVLAGILFLQICVLIYCFTVKKKNYHSDELFSYGLSNSYYQPFINANDHEGLDVINNNQWLSGQVLNHYLSVEPEHRFAYDSVYYNNSKDVHPPFYYMVLHTICSFFPDVFTEWFGFGLNLALFVLSQILLYLIVRRMTDKVIPALAAVLLYGFCQGGIDTFIFIRMYAMAEFFLLLCVYLHVLLLKEEKNKYKTLACLGVVTFLGGMTHYYYFIAAGTISACFCVYYLIKKRYSFLVRYAVVLLSAVALAIAAYPYVLTQLFRFEGSRDLSSSYGGFLFEWRYILSYAASELAGIRLSVMPSYFWIHLTEILLVVVTILLPVCFLLRREIWFKKAVFKFKDMVRIAVKKLFGISILYVSMAVSAAVLMAAVALTVPVSQMGSASTRYVFMIYPLLVILFTPLLDCVAGLAQKAVELFNAWKKRDFGKKQKVRQAVLLFLVLICLLVNHIGTKVNFYFDYETERAINNYIGLEELPKDADYVFVLQEYWLLNCLTVSFRDIQNFFATSKEAVFSLENELNDFSSENPMYLVVEIPDWREMAGEDEEEIRLDDAFYDIMQTAGDIEGERTKEILREYETFFLNLQICDCFEYVGNSAIYGREVFVFQLK